MTAGKRKMKALGFVDTIDVDGCIVRRFIKYDDKGNITDIINYFYDSDEGVTVYVNNLQYNCGSRIDMDLLKAINLNMLELEMELEK